MCAPNSPPIGIEVTLIIVVTAWLLEHAYRPNAYADQYHRCLA